MTKPDLSILMQRFLHLANAQGSDAAQHEIFAGLAPLAPATVALRRALLAGLMQDAQGKFFYRKDARP